MGARPLILRLRSKAHALFALAAYGWICLLLPALHLSGHRADHVHGPDGSIQYRSSAAEEPAAERHAAFDLDLDSLGLLEVAHAGVTTVDCSLADYTMVASCAGVVTTDPAASHTFGDELLARSGHHHAPPPDESGHGANSAAHLALSLVGTAPFLVPPPFLPILATKTPPDAPGRPRGGSASSVHARGPPSLGRTA